MGSRKDSQSGTETFFDEVDITAFSGQNVGLGLTAANSAAQQTIVMGTTSQSGTNPSVLNPVGGAGDQTAYNTGTGMTTGEAEALGTVDADGAFNQMAFSIEKVTVTAKSRSPEG